MVEPRQAPAGSRLEQRAPSHQPLDAWPTGRLISAVARRIEREWNAHLDAWDLNHASLPVLYLLAAGARSQRDLARACAVTEQTMSRILARLERSGYVTRRTHEQDRRRHAVEITPSGRRALVEASDRDAAERMSVRGLQPEQVAHLRGLLREMLAAGGADGDRLPPPEG